ncbi:ESPR domain-containing protein, partial [uncultured Phascolarctobacterium sp.]|uniref:ESPR domain-containing protein n=1 Tax=uncultured Phascolarctobacterium sp. TaxID=512296 RepID=UPI0025DA26CB
MNKVFKVIWSEARNAYVVVSEIAKNHGSKSCSTKKLLAMLIATGVMTCASMAPAMAADPPAEALKHSTVTNGANITVTEDTNKDGGKEYKVALNNDIKLAGDNDYTYVNISGSKGSVWASSSVAAGNVIMDGTTATVSGLGNTTTAYDGFATTGKAATEEQLKEVATEALKHSTVTNGANITVTEDTNKDGGKEYKVALNNDIKLAGDNDYTYVNISGSKGSVWASSSVAAGNVIMDGTTATVSGLGNTTTAYDGFATTGKAATEEQLKEVATEAGKHSKVVNGNNTNVEETTVDGQKV